MKPLLQNIRILIVDDDGDARQLLRSVLEQAGAAVVAAESADAALEAYRHCPPHAIISDIRLGNSDGYEVIKAIRDANKEYRGFTPAVAVTGFESPQEKDRALAAGFNAFFPKPFNPNEVVQAIHRLLRSSIDLAA